MICLGAVGAIGGTRRAVADAEKTPIVIDALREPR